MAQHGARAVGPAPPSAAATRAAQARNYVARLPTSVQSYLQERGGVEGKATTWSSIPPPHARGPSDYTVLGLKRPEPRAYRATGAHRAFEHQSAMLPKASAADVHAYAATTMACPPAHDAAYITSLQNAGDPQSLQMPSSATAAGSAAMAAALATHRVAAPKLARTELDMTARVAALRDRVRATAECTGTQRSILEEDTRRASGDALLARIRPRASLHDVTVPLRSALNTHQAAVSTLDVLAALKEQLDANFAAIEARVPVAAQKRALTERLAAAYAAQHPVLRERLLAEAAAYQQMRDAGEDVGAAATSAEPAALPLPASMRDNVTARLLAHTGEGDSDTGDATFITAPKEAAPAPATVDTPSAWLDPSLRPVGASGETMEQWMLRAIAGAADAPPSDDLARPDPALLRAVYYLHESMGKAAALALQPRAEGDDGAQGVTAEAPSGNPLVRAVEDGRDAMSRVSLAVVLEQLSKLTVALFEATFAAHKTTLRRVTNAHQQQLAQIQRQAALAPRLRADAGGDSQQDGSMSSRIAAAADNAPRTNDPWASAVYDDPMYKYTPPAATAAAASPAPANGAGVSNALGLCDDDAPVTTAGLLQSPDGAHGGSSIALLGVASTLQREMLRRQNEDLQRQVEHLQNKIHRLERLSGMKAGADGAYATIVPNAPAAAAGQHDPLRQEVQHVGSSLVTSIEELETMLAGSDDARERQLRLLGDLESLVGKATQQHALAVAAVAMTEFEVQARTDAAVEARVTKERAAFRRRKYKLEQPAGAAADADAHAFDDEDEGAMGRATPDPEAMRAGRPASALGEDGEPVSSDDDDEDDAGDGNAAADAAAEKKAADASAKAAESAVAKKPVPPPAGGAEGAGAIFAATGKAGTRIADSATLALAAVRRKATMRAQQNQQVIAGAALAKLPATDRERALAEAQRLAQEVMDLRDDVLAAPSLPHARMRALERTETLLRALGIDTKASAVARASMSRPATAAEPAAAVGESASSGTTTALGLTSTRPLSAVAPDATALAADAVSITVRRRMHTPALLRAVLRSCPKAASPGEFRTDEGRLHVGSLCDFVQAALMAKLVADIGARASQHQRWSLPAFLLELCARCKISAAAPALGKNVVVPLSMCAVPLMASAPALAGGPSHPNVLGATPLGMHRLAGLVRDIVAGLRDRALGPVAFARLLVSQQMLSLFPDAPVPAACGDVMLLTMQTVFEGLQQHASLYLSGVKLHMVDETGMRKGLESLHLRCNTRTRAAGEDSDAFGAGSVNAASSAQFRRALAASGAGASSSSPLAADRGLSRLVPAPLCISVVRTLFYRMGLPNEAAEFCLDLLDAAYVVRLPSGAFLIPPSLPVASTAAAASLVSVLPSVNPGESFAAQTDWALAASPLAPKPGTAAFLAADHGGLGTAVGVLNASAAPGAVGNEGAATALVPPPNMPQLAQRARAIAVAHVAAFSKALSEERGLDRPNEDLLSLLFAQRSVSLSSAQDAAAQEAALASEALQNGVLTLTELRRRMTALSAVRAALNEEQMTTMASLYDVDGVGSITARDFARAFMPESAPTATVELDVLLLCVGAAWRKWRALTTANFAAFFAQADGNKDGFVTHTEFAGLVARCFPGVHALDAPALFIEAVNAFAASSEAAAAAAAAAASMETPSVARVLTETAVFPESVGASFDARTVPAAPGAAPTEDALESASLSLKGFMAFAEARGFGVEPRGAQDAAPATLVATARRVSKITQHARALLAGDAAAGLIAVTNATLHQP